MRVLLFIFLVVISCFACKEGPTKPAQPTEVKPKAKPATIPSANADSLFTFVENQLDFGYRIPGTPEHAACKDWLVAKLKSYGASVEVQPFKASFLGKKDQDSYNIIAQFNPKHKNRVLLGAHWDSRLIAEKDPNEDKQDEPISGANDGGSGVAALLEIARQIQLNPIDLGVDIILFDAEDNGVTGSAAANNTWCLGSQYWGKNIQPKGYKAKYGILLDMVGAKNAVFGKEGYSRVYAKNIVDKTWTIARQMGFSDMFINQNSDAIDDDHKYVNELANIPMIDIIDYDLSQRKFRAYHHTHDDNIDIIDKNTLRRVTQVVLAVIYNESTGRF